MIGGQVVVVQIFTRQGGVVGQGGEGVVEQNSIGGRVQNGISGQMGLFGQLTGATDGQLYAADPTFERFDVPFVVSLPRLINELMWQNP